MKNTTIKWIQFTIKNSIDFVSNWITSIYSLYEKPSYEKVKIFDEWNEKLDWITWLTWNKFNFSIYWYIYDNDWIKHNVKITQAYNYLLN
jgi:hypothetical protein